jgi:phosphoglycolate phosphatase
MKKQAVMFDLDGTLLDTLEDLGDAVNMTLRERDLPEHPYPFFRHAVGDGARMLITRSLPKSLRDRDTVDSAHDSLRRHYATTWNIKTHTYAGIVDMLRTLKQQGIVQAILSNKPQAPLVQCVDCFLPADQFSAIQGVVPNGPIKPDPAGAIAIVDASQIPPEAWLYVGDTNTDMHTATAAGLFAVGCTWGFRDRQELLASGADAIIDHPSELLSLV